MKFQAKPFRVEIRRKGRQVEQPKAKGISWDLSAFREALSAEPSETPNVVEQTPSVLPAKILLSIAPKILEIEPASAPAGAKRKMPRPTVKGRPPAHKSASILSAAIAEPDLREVVAFNSPPLADKPDPSASKGQTRSKNRGVASLPAGERWKLRLPSVLRKSGGRARLKQEH